MDDAFRYRWTLTSQQVLVILARLHAEWLELHPLPPTARAIEYLVHHKRWQSVKPHLQALLAEPIDSPRLAACVEQLHGWGEEALSIALVRLLAETVKRPSVW